LKQFSWDRRLGCEGIPNTNKTGRAAPHGRALAQTPAKADRHTKQK